MVETLDVSSMLPNKFEPKRKTRFIFSLEGVDAFLVKSSGQPTVTTERIEIPFVNSRRYVAGKSEFGTMNLVLHDAIAPSGAQQVMEWMRLCYESVSGRSGYADFYKRDCQIKLLDPVGTVVSNWDLKGVFITESNFGDLEYGSFEGIEIALTLSYDQAVLQY